MQVKCEGCGGFHAVSPTGMAVIIQCLQQGDLQRVTGSGVEPLCLGGAFTPETIRAWRGRIKGKVVVAFDESRWPATEAA